MDEHREKRASWELLLIAWVFGTAAGLFHASVVLFRQSVLEEFTWMSRDITWMSPLGNAAVLMMIATPFAIAHLIWPNRRLYSVATFGTAALGTVSALLSFRGLSNWAVLILGAGIGMAVVRANLSTRRIVRAAAIFGLAVLAGVVVSIRSQAETRTSGPFPRGAPNILVVILDTVRAASTSLHGYPRPTTPNLERLAKEGVSFDRAMASAPWTLASHGSMFTGLPASQLSVHWTSALDARYPTIAEVLRSSGYATAAFIGNLYYAHYESGLGRGFGLVRDYRRSFRQVALSTTLVQAPVVQWISGNPTFAGVKSPRNHLSLRTPFQPAVDRPHATRIVDDFLAWRRQQGERPYMAFINLFDAHDPYDPPEPFRTRFADGSGRRDLYDASIAYLDQQVGRLVDSLRREGSLDHTVIIVASDHGEHWGEHNLHSHGNSLYLPLLDVPLVIRFPGRIEAGTKVDKVVSLRDLAATIVDASGVRSKSMPGQSLLRVCCGPKTTYVTTVIAETEQLNPGWPDSPARRGPLAALINDSLSYHRNGDATYELFDIKHDYSEAHNLLATESGCRTGLGMDSVLRAIAPYPATPALSRDGCSRAPTLPRKAGPRAGSPSADASTAPR